MNKSNNSRQPRESLANLVGLIAILWLVEILNIALQHSLSQFGIIPRRAIGLIGIPLSPFLHYGLNHILANTLPLAVLGGLIASLYAGLFNRATIIIILLGGMGVWLFGRSAIHVGASGLVFGYFGFLVARGWYERSFLSIAASLVVIVLYGGMIWGVLPVSAYVSWEAHLFGFLAGIIAAKTL
jgi:membrane associated rhomboid family serine protease